MEIPQHKWIYLIVIFKVIPTIFTGVIMGVGIYAHYKSSWISHASNKMFNISEADGNLLLDDSAIKPYQICQLNNLAKNWGWNSPVVETCPELGMEGYFVGVIIATFVLSLTAILLLLSGKVYMDMPLWQVLELAYHGLFSVLLFTAGIVYIESANEILTFIKHKYPDEEEFLENLMTDTKITVGALTIIQSIIYVIITGLVAYRIKFKSHTMF